VTQHHCFAVNGTDPGKFRELGFKKTTEDDKLEYFVHFHSYTIGEPVPCNDQCQVIRSDSRHVSYGLTEQGSVSNLNGTLPSIGGSENRDTPRATLILLRYKRSRLLVKWHQDCIKQNDAIAGSNPA
jgi:hypothetical protein